MPNTLNINSNSLTLDKLGLNSKQLEAVKYFENPLLILAGAGTGKTKTLTSKIALLIASGIAPNKILAITFTNKAAAEMRQRIAQITPYSSGIWMHTFHALGAKLLRQHGELIGIKKDFLIYDVDDQKKLITLILKELGLENDKNKVPLYINLISKAKDDLIDENAYLESAEASGETNRLKTARIYRLYQAKMALAGALDFGDLIHKTCKLLREKDDLREYYQEHFKYVLVDEYQDTNHAQYVLVKALSEKHQNLCVVGDPDQCLPGETKVMTEKGYVAIKNLTKKDKIISAIGSNKTQRAEINHILKKPFKGNLVEIKTKSKKTLRCTPNHICFARLDPSEKLHYVYLMKKNDLGFRIGTTSGVRTSKDRKILNGIIVRTNQEVADAIWILKTCKNSGEARYFEQLFSLKYQIPTTVFYSKGRNLAINQRLINNLYKELDTVSSAERLMEDLCLNPDYPHHRPFAVTRKGFNRKYVWFTVFGDTRENLSDKTHYHRVQLVTSGNTLRKKAEKNFSVRAGKQNSWRIETSRKDYDEALTLAEKISDLDAMDTISRAKLTKNSPFYFMPASHLREGMKIPVLKDGKIVEDTISSIKTSFYDGVICDISVPKFRNYSANGIVVHNTIYSWRGANIRNIMEFEKDFKNAKTIILEQNYRSTANILNAANKVIVRNRNRHAKDLWTKNNDGEDVEIIECSGEIDESRFVYNKIKKLTASGAYTYNDFVVFYRTNAQSRSFEETFMRMSIPYRIIGSIKFYNRKEIKDAVAYFRLLANPRDTVSLMRVINNPTRGIGKTALEKIQTYALENQLPLFDALENEFQIPKLTPMARRGIKEFTITINNLKAEVGETPLYVIIEKLLTKSGYWQSIENLSEKDPEASLTKLGNLQELVNAVKEFEDRMEKQNIPPSIHRFLENVSLASEVDNLEYSEYAVTLMTVHLAKGLEFPAVFLTGLEDGLFPINASHSSNNEMEEERRLCYVGMTRAKQKLYMTWANTRKIFGKTYPNMASRFLFETELIKGKEESSDEEIPKTTAPYIPKGPQIAPGRKVSHPVYGIGKVVNLVGTGEFTKVTVVFDNGGKQTFMLKYAPLEIV